MDQHRSVGAVGRDDEAQPAALLLGSKALLLVARLNVARLGMNPDLQKVRSLARRGIELAVTHPAAGAHALYVPWPNGGTISHGVLVRKFALEHVADDLHILMRVGTEPRPGLHTIFVDDSQRSKLHVLGIEVIRERKRMERLQPTVIGKTSLITSSNCVHEHLLGAHNSLERPN